MTDRDRRALSQLGGRIRTRGDGRLTAVLAGAWESAAREDPDTLTHGFHSWPARMHRAIPRAVLEHVRPAAVLDPFCGGGTVLIEARVAGCRSIGVDLNPLALRLCDVKTQARPEADRRRFVAAAEQVAAASEARVRARVPIQVAMPGRETRWYAPHVLKELGGLREEIRAVSSREDRRALAMVLSSIVVKVSKQRSDTVERVADKRIRKGLSTELFLRKARELAERWDALADVARGPRPKVIEGDARQLEALLEGRRGGLILTSPPYGGTYDYAAHHARRMAWLELDDRKLRRYELGARRQLEAEDGAAIWDRDVDRMLAAMRGVLRDDGLIVLVMGDADVGGARVEVPAQLARLAPRRGLEVAAVASQPRPDWKGRRAREEHLIALRPAP